MHSVKPSMPLVEVRCVPELTFMLLSVYVVEYRGEMRVPVNDILRFPRFNDRIYAIIECKVCGRP